VSQLGAASVIQAPVRYRRLGGVSTSVPAGSWDPSPVSYGDRYPGINTPIEQDCARPRIEAGQGGSGRWNSMTRS